MSTSLKIFGETYNNVAGIKAKNVNDDTLTYILPSDFTPSLSGNAITVEDTVDPAGGTIRSIEAVDISDSTITSNTIKSGYVGYTANGIRVMGNMTDAVSGQLIYTSGNGRSYTPTMVIDVGEIMGAANGATIVDVLNFYGVMDNLVDLTLTGIIKRNGVGSNLIPENNTYYNTYFPNLKRLTIAPMETRPSSGVADANSDKIQFGHYPFNGSNLRELVLGSIGGAYFAGGGYFRSDCPVPPGSNGVNVGSLDGLRLTIYTNAYKQCGGFYINANTVPASNTIITQYNYLTGEELTA